MTQHDPTAASDAPTPGKGRPTPKRREAEKGRRRPVAAPLNNKEAARLRREEMAANRARIRQAWITGDEKNMPRRDRGPVRRFARDYIDVRMTVAEWFVPLAIVLWILSFVPVGPMAAIGILGMMVLAIVVILELVIVGFGLKRQLARRFPDADRKGAVVYGLLRMTQLRRIRLPRPQVKRFDDLPEPPARRPA